MQHCLRVSLLLIVLIFKSVTLQAQQICWVVADDNNTAYKFIQSTGSILSTISAGIPSSPEAATLNLTGDTLWIIDGDDLYFIDLDAATPTAVLRTSDFDGFGMDGVLHGNNLNFSDYDAMTIDMQNRIWVGSKSTTGAVAVINPKTGTVITDFFGSGQDYLGVPMPSGGAFDAMAIDPFTGDIYANLNDGGGSLGDNLYKIDPASGDTTLVAKFSIVDIEGMGFDGKGLLWATTGANGGSFSNGFYKINLADGTTVRFYNTPASDVEACDCVIGDPFSANEISGYVFHDRNSDTIRQNDEFPSSTLVRLYRDINQNGEYDSGIDTLVDTARTTATGYYYFRISYASGTEYYVINSDPNSLPNGIEYTTDNLETAVFSSAGNRDSLNNFGYNIHPSDVQLCYTISDVNNVAYEYFLSAPSAFIRSTGTPVNPEASTLNLAGDTLFILDEDDLYFIDLNASSLSSQLLRTNIDGFGLTGVNGSKNFSDYDAMTVDKNGIIWACSEGSDANLVVINTKTGFVEENYFGTNIDYIPVKLKTGYNIDAMGIDPLTNELYVCMNTGSGDLGEDDLYKVNQLTGDTTFIATLDVADVEGMGFDALGRLLIVSGDNSDPSSLSNQLWLVDLNDGSTELVASNPGNDAETCDCVIGDYGSINEINGYVFYDDNRDTIFNLLSTDTSHRGFLVYLYADLDHDGIVDPGIDTVVDQRFTNSNGYYSFRRGFLKQKQSYVISTRPADLPESTTYSTDNFETASFTNGGNIDGNNNFGYKEYGNRIRGTVFFDTDSDTVLDLSESGTQGILVYLYSDVNANGVYDPGTDVKIQEVRTGALGNYEFLVPYSGGTDNFVIRAKTTDLPSIDTLTTDNIETAVFSSEFNVDNNNNFGHVFGVGGDNFITGRVFYDDNADTTYQGIEVGQTSVKVYLYRDVDRDGKISASDTIVDSTFTSGAGLYGFGVVRSTTPTAVCSTYVVGSSAGDAEQDGTSNNNLTNNDLDLGDQHVGVQFTGVQIPQGATITSANVEFYAVDDNSSANMTIYGHDVDNAPVFSTSSAQQLTDLSTTTANVAWNEPSAWSIGTYESTPGIQSIISEITSRSGWASGNSLALIILGSSGRHEARSYDGNSAQAPRLNVCYSAILSDEFLLSIDTTTLPAGSSLTTDNLESASFNSTGQTDINNDFGFDRDSMAFNIITGTVFADMDEDTINGTIEPKIEAMTIRLFQDFNGNGLRDPEDSLLQTTTTDENGFYALDVPFMPLTRTIRVYVTQNSDDAEQNGTSNNTLTNGDLDLGDQNVGVRFQGIDIPQGAEILNANVYFYAVDDNSSASADIYGFDVDNAPTFSSSPSDRMHTLTRTTNDTSWTMSSPWVIGQYVSSPDISNIVEEIVGRAGWSPLNSLAILFLGTGGQHEANAHDNSAANAPYIEITYALPNLNNFIVTFDSSTMPAGSYLTTDHIEIAQFTSGGNIDQINDFGFWGGALPVEWLSFDAERVDERVLLTWSTASEKNNDFFLVERAGEDLNFMPIGQVKGNGTTLNISSYSFTDEMPMRGNNYYRLQQVDMDGEFEYSPVRVVFFESRDIIRISAFPNPFSDHSTIRITASRDLGGIDVTVTDLTGRILFQEHYTLSDREGEFSIETGAWQQGPYLLHVQSAGEVLTKWIIKH